MDGFYWVGWLRLKEDGWSDRMDAQFVGSFVLETISECMNV